MENRIEDYLHLYLGCECVHCGEVDEQKMLTGVSFDSTQNQWWAYFEDNENCYAKIEEVRPILRTLNDISKEEYNHIWNVLNTTIPVLHNKAKMEPKLFAYLLSKGFDLFNLIDSGLAVDKNSITPREQVNK